MDAVELLKEAEKVGLVVRTDGTKLVVSGPRSAEAVAEQLFAHKAALLSYLELPEEWRPVVRWASWLVEHEPQDEARITFQEAPMRTVTLRLSEVGRYLTERLASLSMLWSWGAAGPKDVKPGWRAEQIKDICSAIAALREAVSPYGLADHEGHNQ